MKMNHGYFLSIFLFAMNLLSVGVTEERGLNLEWQFTQSEQKNGSITLYWLNSELNKEAVKEQIELLKQNGFSGVAPLPMRRTKPAYLSEEYFDFYKTMLDSLAERNMEQGAFSESG
ncbi:MAG: hypothetical protein LBT05_02540 [Planctomycetaceae bacterium]|jgi:hypothetical protein|nr:hypothetical protein [Planctomycetaceae bacterium]